MQISMVIFLLFLVNFQHAPSTFHFFLLLSSLFLRSSHSASHSIAKITFEPLNNRKHDEVHPMMEWQWAHPTMAAIVIHVFWGVRLWFLSSGDSHHRYSYCLLVPPCFRHYVGLLWFHHLIRLHFVFHNWGGSMFASLDGPTIITSLDGYIMISIIVPCF